MVDIPEEVKHWVLWKYGAKPYYPEGITEIDPERVVFVPKATSYRDEGWRMALKKRPILPGEYNPWRKCHTEHYWCWYLKYTEPKFMPPRV